MRLDLKRWREIAAAPFASFKGRLRVALLLGCLGVFALAWWGTAHIAGRVFSDLPQRDSLATPQALTPGQVQKQIDDAQQLNARIREQRESARASAMEELQAGTLAPEPGMDAAAEVVTQPGGQAATGDPAARDAAAGAAAERVPAPDEYVPTDRAAEPIRTVPATYPAAARTAGVEGTVVVQALVGVDGAVHETRILSPLPGLNDAAAGAVRQWRFRPAQQDGHAIATWVNVPVTFRR